MAKIATEVIAGEMDKLLEHNVPESTGSYGNPVVVQALMVELLRCKAVCIDLVYTIEQFEIDVCALLKKKYPDYSGTCGKLDTLGTCTSCTSSAIDHKHGFEHYEARKAILKKTTSGLYTYKYARAQADSKLAKLIKSNIGDIQNILIKYATSVPLDNPPTMNQSAHCSYSSTTSATHKTRVSSERK